MRRVLLIGATGAFGSRLAAMLAKLDGIELILAARKIELLDRVKNELNSRGAIARMTTIVFDKTHPDDISSISPWAVIDAAGPFQGSDYTIPLAAINCGAHYVDLSDARAYATGFAAALDAQARANNVLAVTGASSTPALSHAALTQLVAGWRQIDDVVVAISPGAKAPRGLSVVQAILSYAGQPTRVFDNGQWQQDFGWSGVRRLVMPGLGARWVSLCDTPDLDLLPKNFPIHRSALFLAGLELAPMHLGLSALSLLVRWKLMRSLRPFARPLRVIAGLLAPFGSDRGGMLVQASGRDGQDRPTISRWSLLAEKNAGPNVPAAAAAAMIRALLSGRETRTGAQACVGLLSCEAILDELINLPISTCRDEVLRNNTPPGEKLRV
ncbi:MAG: saccharopine dehydrogenase NADP-binding domain-containing protein [Pseudomonadota bacterium]|nr:saccharopine dehydrogenase NADP-binding domain-containing protein [Afipia sp.]